MNDSTSRIYDAPTGKLMIEFADGEYRLIGEFEGTAQELGCSTDLRSLVMSLASSPNASQPLMENIKMLQSLGETHRWDWEKMAS